MPTPKPVCQTLYPWLKSNLGKRCLAPITGTDDKALRAAVHLVELYSYQSSQEVADAFRLTVWQMQPHCRELAYHAIAHVMDWSHRDQLWAHATLPDIEAPRICSFGPGGSREDLAKV